MSECRTLSLRFDELFEMVVVESIGVTAISSAEEVVDETIELVVFEATSLLIVEGLGMVALLPLPLSLLFFASLLLGVAV